MSAEYALQGKLEKARQNKKGRGYSRRYGQARREALRRIELYEETAALFEPLRDALEIVDVAGIRLRSPQEARQRLDEVITALSRLPHKKVQDIAATLDRQKEELIAYAGEVHRELPRRTPGPRRLQRRPGTSLLPVEGAESIRSHTLPSHSASPGIPDPTK